MAGRRAQPLSIIKAKGKSHHITKKEAERRKKAEIKVDDKKLKIPDYVKIDTEAFKKWKEIVALYKNIDVVTAIDSTTLGRYCKHHSEYLYLLKQKQLIENLEIKWEDYCMPVTEFVSDGITRFFKLDPLMKLENLINKKSQLLITLEDRLFLNPVSRIKNVPKKEKEEKDPNALMFGDG